MVLAATIPRGAPLADDRARLALTQQESAEQASCSRYPITKIESGVIAPRPTTRRQIAAALGVGPEKVAWPRRIARPGDGDGD